MFWKSFCAANGLDFVIMLKKKVSLSNATRSEMGHDKLSSRGAIMKELKFPLISVPKKSS